MSFSLHAEAKALAARVRALANQRDADFIQSADPRALQGGAISWDAHEIHEIADQLLDVALQLENVEG
jgi:hypothetical protein